MSLDFPKLPVRMVAILEFKSPGKDRGPGKEVEFYARALGKSVIKTGAQCVHVMMLILGKHNQSETAVHCCDPALSVLVTLVSRNVFHVVSALPSIVFIHFFCLIRSLVDPTLAALIVYGPLQFISHSFYGNGLPLTFCF